MVYNCFAFCYSEQGMAAFPRGSSFKEKKDNKRFKNKRRIRYAGTGVKRKSSANVSLPKKKQKKDVKDQLIEKMKVFYLKKKNLQEGMLFLASIKDVIGNSCLVCSSRDISFILKKQKTNVSIGDFLLCKVMEDNGNGDYTISFDPKDVNSTINWNKFPLGGRVFAKIASEEDHGYLINFGKSKLRGFLPFDECSKSYKSGDVGFFYLKVRTAKVLKFSGKEVESSNGEFSSLEQLLPGQIVEAKKICNLSGGICVQFNGNFIGSIVDEHLLSEVGDSDFRAQIISVNFMEKVISLSTIHCLNEDSFDLQDFLAMKGKRINESRITRTIEDFGAYLRVGKYKAFLPLKRIDIDRPLSKMKSEELLDVRCYETNPFDRMLIVSSEANIVESTIYSPDEIYAGLITTGIVHKIGDFGLILNFCLGLQGLVPLNQLSDILINPFKKYSIGDKVVCRVISTVYDEHLKKYRFTLSLKKSIIRSKLPIVAESSNARPGRVTHGVVTKRTEKKVFVSFYNQQFGIIPWSDLQSFGVTEVMKTYQVGQTVRVRIVASLPGGALELSLRTSLEQKNVAVGSIETCKIISSTKNSFKVNLINRNITATLPFNQLAETVSFGERLASKYSIDQLIDNVIVIINHGRVVVSARNSLLFWANNRIEDDTPNSLYPGWVAAVDDDFLQVNFLSRTQDSTTIESAHISRKEASLLNLRGIPLSSTFVAGQTIILARNGQHKNGNPFYSLREELIYSDESLIRAIQDAFLENMMKVYQECKAGDKFVMGERVDLSLIRKTPNRLLLYSKTNKDINFVATKQSFVDIDKFKMLQVNDSFSGIIVGHNLETNEYFIADNRHTSDYARIVFVAKTFVILDFQRKFYITWLSFNSLDISRFLVPGLKCEIETVGKTNKKGFWKDCQECLITSLENKSFPKGYLRSIDNVKNEIQPGSAVRYRVMEAHTPRGVVSVVPLNLNRTKVYKTNTFIGISITDLFLESGKLPKQFKNPLEKLRVGSIQEGDIVEVIEQDEVVKHKVLIKPRYIEHSLSDAQVKLVLEDKVIGICTGVSDEGVVVQINRKTTGIIAFLSITDDLDLLNSLDKYDDQEAKLQVLGFELYQQVDIILQRSTGVHTYEVAQE